MITQIGYYKLLLVGSVAVSFNNNTILIKL